MALVAPPRYQPETTRAPEVPEMLFPEARRRRRRRWMVGIAVVVLCASGVGVGFAVSSSGSGGGTGRGAYPGSPDPARAKLSAAAASGAVLAGGRWTMLVPPHPGVETMWDLAAWTGKFVIAWGSANPCCATASGKPTEGSSEHGAAFDPVTHSWRSMPPAPVDVTIESTIWTGRQVLVWGSASTAARRANRNTLLEFDPTTWRWKRLATPPIALRSAAEVLWSGTRLIVIGGQANSITALLNGATYDPRANRWKALPTVPHVAAGASEKEVPVSLTAAWAANTLYVWVTRQVSQACGANCGEISARVQPLRWIPGASLWHPGPTPPKGTSVYDATAVSMGRSIALLDGSSCLPGMSCPSGVSGTPALLDVTTDKWSSIAMSGVLDIAQSFVWTGRNLVAVSPYLTSDGHLVGGYAAAFDAASDSWANLPDLPVPTAPPSGPVLSGTVWAGSELIDSGLVLKPGHISSTTGPSAASTVPTCPPITFPELVGGTFCGPPPGPGNGSGPDGSCLGTETAPPCGPGVVAGRYYAYTLISNCTNDYLDGRWWTNELPGGAGPLEVWMSVNATGTGAGWIGPNGAVGFRPSVATSCS